MSGDNLAGLTPGWAAVLINLIALLCAAAYMVGGLSARVGDQRVLPPMQTAEAFFLSDRQCPDGSQPILFGNRRSNQESTRFIAQCE